MHNTIAHHPLTNTYLIPKEWLAHSWVTPHSLYCGMISYSKEHPFDQLRSVLLATLPSSFLCTSSMAEHGVLQSPLFRVSTTFILILNPEHSTDQLKQGQLDSSKEQPASGKKYIFLPVKAQATP